MEDQAPTGIPSNQTDSPSSARPPREIKGSHDQGAEMIVGVGFDLEDIADFGRTMDQSGEPFLNRVYTAREIKYCQSQPHARQSYTARYCAKEATMKALGIARAEG